MVIHLEGRCLEVPGTNTSVIYDFPQLKVFNGTKCDTLERTDTIPVKSTDGTGSRVWLGYTAPTRPPTATPSLTPTTAPSASLAPTVTPTEQTLPSFRVNAKVVLNSLTAAVLDDNSKAAIVVSVCSTMQLSAESCHYSNISFVQTGETFAAVVTVATTVALVDHPEFEDVDSLYDSVAALLTDSFTNGAFAVTLAANAVLYHAPALSTTGLELVTLDEPEVQQPPSHSPTQLHFNSNNLSDGEFAGIVVGVLVCLTSGAAIVSALL